MAFIGGSGSNGPWDIRSIKKQHNKFLADHDRFLLSAANDLVDASIKNARAQRYIKNRTGALKRGWQKALKPIPGGYNGRVYSLVPHAWFQERGTGLWGPNKRRIVPIRAKALRWVDPGGVVHFAKSVRGVPPKWIGKKSTIAAWMSGREKFTRSAKRLASHF